MTFRYIAALFFCASQAAAEDLPDYVGSSTCIDCHEDAGQSWMGSHHQMAWTLPDEDTVVADFDGTHFNGNGMEVDFSKDDAGYHISVSEAGQSREYDIHSVVGIAPLQQYLIETEPGRLQSFDVVWDDDRKEWYHLYPDQDLPPDDGLHWTGPYKNWNARCAECHATDFSKNYDAASDSYASVQSEIGVGCEACHGPGATHVEWATTKEPVASDLLDSYGFTMATDAGAEGWIQQCAGCHSRRQAFGDGNPVPGTPYHDSYRLSVLTPDLYYPDGQIMAEVYVYGSFLQSKMYDRGVSCMNCHEPHSGQLKAEDNSLCTQCHSTAGNPQFPTLPLAEFDDPSHHHHEPGSAGAECRSCHMPETTYMGIDERADHSFRIPRPDLTASTGAPDACTGCHEDKEPDWAAAQIEDWFPDSVHRTPQFGEVFARARMNPVGETANLLSIATDAGMADIVQATALYLLRGSPDPSVLQEAVPLLQDDNPLIREHALGLMQQAGPQMQIQHLVAALDDPSRNVRIAAARQMVGSPIAHLPDAMAENLKSAMEEWQTSLALNSDFPETHLVLSGTALTMRNFPAALAGFRKVVEMDPQRADAWSMIVRLEAAMNGQQAGRQAVREALRRIPGDANLQALAEELYSTPAE